MRDCHRDYDSCLMEFVRIRVCPLLGVLLCHLSLPSFTKAQLGIQDWLHTQIAPIEFAMSNNGQLGYNGGVDEDGRFIYPRGTNSVLMHNAGCWIAAKKSPGSNPIMSKTKGLASGSWFVPGSLVDGNKYREDLYPRYKHHLRFAQEEPFGKYVRMQYHDGDLTRYDDYDSLLLRSLGYPIGIDVESTVFTSFDRFSCDGCVTITYSITNRSAAMLHDVVVAFVTSITLGDKGMNFYDIIKHDRCGVIQSDGAKIVHCLDESEIGGQLSSVALAVFPQTDHVYTYQILPFASLWRVDFDSVRSGVDVLYRTVDSASVNPAEPIVFAPVHVGDLRVGESATVTFAVIPIEAPAIPDSAARIREALLKYQYLAQITSINEERLRKSAASSIIRSRSISLMIDDVDCHSLRLIDVAGRYYSLPVVGGTVNTSALPLGVYIVLDDAGKVLQRLCLVD